jgi:tape measure domain-containing protein
MADNDARLQVVLEAKIDKLTERLSAANRAMYGSANRFQRDVDRINRKFESLGSGLGVATDRIRGYLAAIGVGLSIREVQQYADAWTNARNKLAAAGVAVGDLASRQNELADLANRTRTSFDATVDLYSKLTRATQTLGLSQQEVAQLTETLNMAFKAGGASTQEQTAAILQLSQALSSGALQGDELRSIRENAPLLAKAIADEFGVTIGALKDLGAEGLLTSDRIVKAVQRARGEIEATFKSTIPTIGDAFTKLETEFGRYINSANAATGASAQLAGFISTVADNFDLLADAAVVTASVIGGALAGQALARAVAGLTALAGGATGAAGAMALLRGAMAFLGGPWGVAITAIGAALGYLALESGRAKVEFAALEQRINGQTDASVRATAAADRQRQATGNLTAAELDAARKTAALTGEVRLLEDAHYRAAAAAKAHALAEAGARVEAAKTDALQARRFSAQAERRITGNIRGPIEPGSRGAAGGAAIAGANPQGIINRSVAATREAALLRQADANLKKAEADLAAVRARSLKDPNFKPGGVGASGPAAAGGGGGGGGRTRGGGGAAEPRDRTDERLAQIDAAMADAERQLTAAMLDLATNVDERAKLQRAMIDAETAEAKARIDRQVAEIADDKGLSEAKKQQFTVELLILKAKQDEIASLQRQAVDRDAAEQKARDALALRQNEIDAQAAMLIVQERLAKTAAQQRDIQLRLLDLADQREKAEIEAILASQASTDIEKEIARRKLEVLEATRAGREEEVRERTSGPFEDFRRRNDRERLPEVREEILTRGLEDFADGLADAIVNAKSLGDVARNVFRQMAADLLAATIRSTIAQATGGGLSGFLSAGLGLLAGSFGGAGGATGVKNISAVKIKAARGGLIQGPGTQTSDDVFARLSSGEFVVNAAATQRNLGLLRAINSGVAMPSMARPTSQSFSPTMHINVTGGGMTAADARRTGAQIGSAAMHSMALARRKGFA